MNPRNPVAPPLIPRWAAHDDGHRRFSPAMIFNSHDFRQP